MASFVDVLDYKPAFDVIAIHLPIGLPDKPQQGGRTCDREARKLLGFPRSGAILSAPARPALSATTYDKARRLNKGMSAVAYGLLPKIAEVAKEMQPYWQRTVFEVHPELGFYQLNDDTPLRFGKHTALGLKERRTLLEQRMEGIERVIDAKVKGAQRHHLVDAAIDLWTARRIIARSVSRVPEDPEWDEQGLRTEIMR